VYEATDSARIEAVPGAHVIQAQVAGKVVRTQLALGDEVDMGDVLVELDATREALELDEERAKLSGFTSELNALDDERAATDRSLQALRSELPLAVREAELGQRELEVGAELAEHENSRVLQLRKAGVASEQDGARANAVALRERALAEASSTATLKLEAQRSRLVSERMAAVSALDRERAQLAREVATSRARILVLERIITLRTIRAPASGRLAQIHDLQIGTVLDEGSRVAVIVPRGSLRVVANFRAAPALGRLRAGQNAWLRLDGFPWTEYGKPRAVVEHVGTEALDGKVRVELSLLAPPAHLSHGLAASVEVEVEQLAPAALLARVATRKLTGNIRSVSAEGSETAQP
jgi:membrane fusion protein (multidrug efflux system)